MSGKPTRERGGEPSAKSDAGSALRGKKVVVGVSGGIACYKAASLVSSLVQRGAEVRVLMTEGATKFVTPLTFQSLSGKSVITNIWEADDHPESQHVGVARWAEFVILAPATANTIAAIAAGLAHDPVTLTLSALPRAPRMTPVLVAPSMNAQMWENPITQRNVATLRDILGYQIVGPDEGWQACRTSGAGRMSSPEAILAVAEACAGL